MRDAEFLRRALAGSALVLEMAILSVGGLFAGAWLDRRFGTSPGLLFLLTLVGFVGGLSRLLHALGQPHGPPPDDPR
jgi:F0F1-type ATP synthase assembly protein I